MKLTRRLIGIYFLIASILFYLFYCISQGTEHFFSYIIPNFIATIVFIVYILSAYLYLKKPFNEIATTFFIVVLVIQCIQIELFGYVFKNLVFPELSFRINLKDLSTSQFYFSQYSFKAVNGYFSTNTNNIISVNLLQLILVFVVSFIPSKPQDKNHIPDNNII